MTFSCAAALVSPPNESSPRRMLPSPPEGTKKRPDPRAAVGGDTHPRGAGVDLREEEHGAVVVQLHLGTDFDETTALASVQREPTGHPQVDRLRMAISHRDRIRHVGGSENRVTPQSNDQEQSDGGCAEARQRHTQADARAASLDQADPLEYPATRSAVTTRFRGTKLMRIRLSRRSHAAIRPSSRNSIVPSTSTRDVCAEEGSWLWTTAASIRNVMVVEEMAGVQSDSMSPASREPPGSSRIC